MLDKLSNLVLMSIKNHSVLCKNNLFNYCLYEDKLLKLNKILEKNYIYKVFEYNLVYYSILKVFFLKFMNN